MLCFCIHCGGAYSDTRSHAELRLTYCGILCERAEIVPPTQILAWKEPPRKRSQLSEEEQEALLELLRDDWLIHEGGT